MNRKQFTLLLLFVLVIGALGLLVQHRQKSAWQDSGRSAGGKILGRLPVNDVAQITIKQGQGELNLVKKDDLWRVKERQDYPANFTDISEFLRQALDLKFVQKEKVGPSLLPRYELVAPAQGTNSGTLVELKDKQGKTINSLLLGKKHLRKSSAASQFGEDAWPDGRYVMVGNDPAQVGVIANPLSNLEPKPENWLNKDFFKVENIRAVSIAFTNATNSWRLTRENAVGEFKLADLKPGEELDANKIAGLGNVLSSPGFNDVVSPSAGGTDTGLDAPMVATLETFDDFMYTIKIGKKTGEDNYHFQMSVRVALPKERAASKDEKPEEKEKLDKEFKEKTKRLEEKFQQERAFEPWVYLVSRWTIDPLLKERPELLAEKKEEPKKDEAPKDEKPAATPDAK